MSNENLHNARMAKNDEFYTQYMDIQSEVSVYYEHNHDVFRDKVIYCNADDPYESNFFKYFVLNFNRFGLKQLITTSYKPSPVANTQLELFNKSNGQSKVTANKFIINEVDDINGDGELDLRDVALMLQQNKNNEWVPLEGDGDFRSEECIELLKQSDIVITNPPFSLFREYVAQLFEYEKKFLIIGSINAITYKEAFPLIKDNKMWLGNGFKKGGTYFYNPKTGFVKFGNVRWLTNIDYGNRYQPLKLITMNDNLRYNTKLRRKKNVYKKYDNYNAIEIPYTDAIPSDYDGVMGVPISFLDRYNPEQFEIVELPSPRPMLNGKILYARIFIKHKKGE